VSNEPFDLSGRVAVVTGAASGIGRATVRRLAGCRARVVAGDIDAEAGQAVVDELRSAGYDAAFAPVDVADRDSVERLVATAVDRFGPPDVMANVAGVVRFAPVLDIPPGDAERMMAVNFFGTLYGCQAAARVMVARGTGSIINVTSASADLVTRHTGAYAASKAAVAMLTRQLATEVGAEGVRVNAISPGLVETGMSAHNFTREDGSVDEELLQQYRERAGKATIVGRVGQPDDIASAAVYLASDASAFVTGQILRVNGGMVMPL